MFKILVLQHLYNVYDDGIEYQIRDRHSFCRFLGRDLEDKVSDAKTIWLFREQLRIEHVFGSMTNEQGGLCYRVIGLARTATKIGLMNLVYNMRRLVQIDRLRASGV